METQLLRRTLTERHVHERYGFLITTHGDILLMDQDEPRTYQEVVVSPNFEKWLGYDLWDLGEFVSLALGKIPNFEDEVIYLDRFKDTTSVDEWVDRIL